jgi:hypothetical protein
MSTPRFVHLYSLHSLTQLAHTHTHTHTHILPELHCPVYNREVTCHRPFQYWPVTLTLPLMHVSFFSVTDAASDPDGAAGAEARAAAAAGKKPAVKPQAERGAKRKRWGQGMTLGSTADSSHDAGAAAAGDTTGAGAATVPVSWQEYEKSGWTFDSDAVAQLDREQAGELGPWVSALTLSRQRVKQSSLIDCLSVSSSPTAPLPQTYTCSHMRTGEIAPFLMHHLHRTLPCSLAMLALFSCDLPSAQRALFSRSRQCDSSSHSQQQQ